MKYISGLLCAIGVFLANVYVLALDEDWTNSCNRCKCQWTSTKRKADCENTSQYTIPKDLSPEVQVLDLSYNTIAEIQRREFIDARLQNLHKLFMKNCTLQEIHRDAFNGLELLIELDMSMNNLQRIHPGTFDSIYRIRTIKLQDNEIQQLEDKTFKDLIYLSKIELQNNRIMKISTHTFLNLQRLQSISLEFNRLQVLYKESFEGLIHLSSLQLWENPWNCTCDLKAFRDFVTDKNLYQPPTYCAYPKELQNKSWKEIDPEQFACQPKIIRPVNNDYLKRGEGSISIFCRAKGSPIPEIEWIFNKKPVNTYDQRIEVKLYKEKRRRDSVEAVTSELTIARPRQQDQGAYTCIAKNNGGTDQMDFQLDVPAEAIVHGNYSDDSITLIIFYLFLFMLFLLLLGLAVFCCCYYKRRKERQKNSILSNEVNGGLNASKNSKLHNDSILEGGSVIMEMQTSLLTEVNPVEKPPRRTDVDSIGKEQIDDGNDAKQILLDDSTCVQEDDTSLQLSDSQPRSRTTFVDDGYGTNLPPDLLAFSRFQQSPSLQSSISNINEPKMYNKVPMVSSPYGHIPISGFRTLQHPKTGRTIAVPTHRSNSPFIPAPIVYPVSTVQRAGYVTVPRKNRTPSWTPTLVSEYSSMSPTSPVSPDLAEPVYDNLGLRTTAAGNSSLNLNKLSVFSSNNNQSSSVGNLSAGANLKKYSMKDRKLPAIPTDETSSPSHSNNDATIIGQSANLEPLYSSTSTGKSKIPPKVPPKPQKKPQNIIANANGETMLNDSTNGSSKLETSDSKVISKIYEDCDGTEV